jgi:hypothetical protein
MRATAMKRYIPAIAMLTLGVFFASASAESAPDIDEKYRNWQIKRLLSPDENQLKLERQGRVYIYDGLRDRDIHRALNEQFDRVESMMFIGTVITDEKGKPKKDIGTGLILTEPDDC